nr:LacI family DNA-binding transcriptional regulator [Psychromicrobium sp. YIM S02556]
MSLTPDARPAVTRKDVARLAGVSTAVVSYVINDGPRRVSPATALKVRDAVAVLGYRPNAAARALKLGSSELLGMVVPVITNPFFASLTHAVERAAARRGYALLVATSGGSVKKEREQINHLASRRVDGVFLSSVLFEPDLSDLEELRIPSVLLNHSVEASGFNSVGVQLAEGSRVAVDHLRGHGHRDIALVMGNNAGRELDGREVGWRWALAGVGLPEGPVFRVDFDREGGYLAGQRFLTLKQPPHAVYISSDLQAVGFLRAMHEAGVRVPEEVAIVSFDGSLEAEYAWPRLTTVAQPIVAMAEAAVTALIDGGSTGQVRNQTFPAELVIGRSCGCEPTYSGSALASRSGPTVPSVP